MYLSNVKYLYVWLATQQLATSTTIKTQQQGHKATYSTNTYSSTCPRLLVIITHLKPLSILKLLPPPPFLALLSRPHKFKYRIPLTNLDIEIKYIIGRSPP